MVAPSRVTNGELKIRSPGPETGNTGLVVARSLWSNSQSCEAQIREWCLLRHQSPVLGSHLPCAARGQGNKLPGSHVAGAGGTGLAGYHQSPAPPSDNLTLNAT